MWVSSWKDAGISMRKTWWCLPVLLSTAFASMADKPPLPPDPTENPVMVTSGFLNSHPDLRYRLLGMEAMREDRHGDAFKFFRRAAHFADKPSQGMVAEMLFFQSDEVCETSYKDRGGKYQGQTGVTLPRT